MNNGCRQFRHQAASDDYASCWSCSLGPRAALINDDLYANDCYGSIVPCVIVSGASVEYAVYRVGAG